MDQKTLYRVEWSNRSHEAGGLIVHVAVESPTEIFDNAVKALAKAINCTAERYDQLPAGWFLRRSDCLGWVYL